MVMEPINAVMVTQYISIFKWHRTIHIKCTNVNFWFDIVLCVVWGGEGYKGPLLTVFAISYESTIISEFKIL